ASKALLIRYRGSALHTLRLLMMADLNRSFVPFGLDCRDKEAVYFLIYFYLKGVEMEAGACDSCGFLNAAAGFGRIAGLPGCFGFLRRRALCLPSASKALLIRYRGSALHTLRLLMMADLNRSFVPFGLDRGDKDVVYFFIYFYLKSVEIEAGACDSCGFLNAAAGFERIAGLTGCFGFLRRRAVCPPGASKALLIHYRGSALHTLRLLMMAGMNRSFFPFGLDCGDKDA